KGVSGFGIAARLQLRRLQMEYKILDSIERRLRVFESFERKIQLFAIPHGYQQIANRERLESFLDEISKREEIALRLRHLLALDEQMFSVDPKANKRTARYGLALGDFVFVMRKNVVHTAAMDVERFAQVLHRHRGTLEVPPGPAFAKRRLPSGLA